MGSPLTDVKWRTIEKTPISMPFRSRPPFSSVPKTSQQRRSLIHNEKLLQIFASKPDEPLHPRKASTSLLENYLFEGADENTPPEYNNKITAASEVTRTFFDNSPLLQNITIGKLNIEWNTGMSPKTPPANSLKNPVVSRTQKDLDSPSAAIRLRAIKALNNPNNNANAYFDVPYEEQDIITDEERKSFDQIPSIQEVMRHVVVYVEVRTGVDNRSAGVRKVISSLGAKVNDKFLRDTTHVVFKDGLQSTYNKAKKWNIPVVSILWIEECKRHKKIMDPELFPIINLERYENPELFSKLKRQKSLQPDAEESIRTRRRKLKTTETESEKTVKLSSEIRVPRKPKDKLESILSEFQEKLMNTPDNTDDPLQFESKILQRIRNSPCTPKPYESSNSQINNSRAASFTVPKTRSELLINNNYDDYKDSELKDNKTPIVRSSRSSTRKSLTSIKKGRGSLHCTEDCDTNKNISSQKKNVSYITKNQGRMTSIIEGREEKNTTIEDFMLDSTSKNGKRRRTEFKDHSSEMPEKTNRSITSTKSSRRKTMFVTKPVEVEKESEAPTSDIICCRRTLFNPINVTEEISKGNSLELNSIKSRCDTVETSTDKDAFVKTPNQLNTLFEEHASTAVFNSTRKPSRRRTLFDISMDIIDQRLQNINKSAKLTKPSNDAGLVDNNTPTSVPRESKLNIITNDEAQLNSEPDNNGNHIEEEITDSLPKKRKLFVPVELTMTPSSIQNFSAKKSDSRRRIRENDESNSNNSQRRRKTLFNINLTGIKQSQNSGDNDAISKANNSSAIKKQRASMSVLVNANVNGLGSETVDEVQSSNQSVPGSCVEI